MKHIILITFNLLIVFSAYCQQKTIQGYVYDEVTLQALPYANISINNTGTITNKEGFFKFKFSGNKQYLINIKISYVGYESKYISIKNSDTHKIYLKSKEAIIPEAIIKADFIYNLLIMAFEKIPENYPDKGSRQKGFFRQTVTKKDSIVYMGEAFMDSYKSSYKRKCEDNQIEIVKFRKFIGQNNYENSFRLYGGPFLIYNIDMVKLRARFLNPDYYKDYNYEYNKIVSFQDNDHYELRYESKSKDFSGKILINKKDYAYTYFELNSQDTIIENGYIKCPFSCNVMYSKIEDQYYLNNYISELLFTNPETKEELLAKVNYTVVETNINNASPINYKNTMAYKNIFMNEIIDTSNNFWDNYNIIENDSSMNNFINTNIHSNEADIHSNKSRKLHLKIYKFIKNFSYSIGAGTHWINTDLYANKLKTVQSNGDIAINTVNQDNKALFYGYFSLGYHFSKKSEINYSYSKDRFSDNLYTCRDLSYIYRTRIKNYGKPIFLNTELGVSFFRYEKNAKFQDETLLFLNKNLVYMGIKGTDLYIATGLTAFLSNSFAVSLKFQLSYTTDYSTIFKYEQGSSDVIYKPINTNTVGFTDKLSTSISIGFSYYLGSF